MPINKLEWSSSRAISSGESWHKLHDDPFTTADRTILSVFAKCSDRATDEFFSLVASVTAWLAVADAATDLKAAVVAHG